MVGWNSLNATISNKDSYQGLFHQFRSIEFCYEKKAIWSSEYQIFMIVNKFIYILNHIW